MENNNSNIEYVKPFATFSIVFQITKTIMFEVKYIKRGDNQEPYFVTTAMQFNRPKSDYKTCGQCQDKILPIGSTARGFYRKWDKFHCKEINSGAMYNELMWDLDKMRNKYNYFERFDNRDVTFNQCVSLSKEPLKKSPRRERNDI